METVKDFRGGGWCFIEWNKHDGYRCIEKWRKEAELHQCGGEIHGNQKENLHGGWVDIKETYE